MTSPCARRSRSGGGSGAAPPRREPAAPAPRALVVVGGCRRPPPPPRRRRPPPSPPPSRSLRRRAAAASARGKFGLGVLLRVEQCWRRPRDAVIELDALLWPRLPSPPAAASSPSAHATVADTAPRVLNADTAVRRSWCIMSCPRSYRRRAFSKIFRELSWCHQKCRADRGYDAHAEIQPKLSSPFGHTAAG